MECPLSVGQEALWFVYRMAPDSTAYNVAFTTRVLGRIDYSALDEAARWTAHRHDLLRSVFTEIEGVPRRIVSEAGRFRLELRDVGAIDDAALDALVRAEVARPFRLSADAPARLVLLRMGENDAALSFVAHHIALDLPSVVVVLQDLLLAYQALAAGRRPELSELSLHYQDFVAAERSMLDAPRGAELAAFWRDVCADAPTTLNLPVDRPRPAHRRLCGGSHIFQVPPDVASGLLPAARRHRTTPVRYVVGVYQALLHRYARQPDFLLGCVVTSNLGLSGLGVAGYFSNVIPLRARLTERSTFRDAVAGVASQLRAAKTYVDYPFALLPRALGSTRSSGTAPLFQVLVSMLSVGRSAPLLRLAAGGHGTEVDFGGLRLSTFDVPQQEGQFDLTLELVRDSSAMRVAMKYDTDLFDASTIRRLSDHFMVLLRAAGADPDQRVAGVALTDESERARLLAFATGAG
jgi:hypothetical protein